MADKIKAGAIPIEEIAPVSVSLRFESELRSNGRKVVYKPVRKGHSRRAYFRLASWQRALWVLPLCLVVAAAPASAQSGSALPTVNAIVDHMAQARAENRARFRPYVVTRDYKLFGKEQYDIKAQVIADVTFVPPNLKVRHRAGQRYRAGRKNCSPNSAKRGGSRERLQCNRLLSGQL